MTQDKPLWSAFVKAADGVTGPPRPSLAWAKARRRPMHIYADRVEIGDWVLPHADITTAILYETERGIKNRVLELATPSRAVQINFNPGTSPEGHLPYPIEKAPFPKHLAYFRVVFWAVFAIAIAIIIFGS